MKKTLTALAAIAALGTGIIAAQAETGYNANENISVVEHSNSTVSGYADDVFDTSQGNIR